MKTQDVASDTRALDDHAATGLKPGDEHYRAYVGPPERYDLMGATQFRLLATLGLRETHKLLDFGCGSLRAGRLLIPYLDAGCYHAVEPNRWLIDDCVARHLGAGILDLKSPRFSDNADFTVPFDDVRFDFILAQSIFSHTGVDIVEKLLGEFARVLAQQGIVALTFSICADGKDFTGQGWVYPACVRYSVANVVAMARRVGLTAVPTPYFHPSQMWFVLARDPAVLPRSDQMALLNGAVFNVKEFERSLGAPDGRGQP